MNGSDVSLKYFSIASSRYGLKATNVVGTFSVFASKLNSSKNLVNYSLCYRPSYLYFSKNELQATVLIIYCSNVWVIIDDSRMLGGLGMDYSVMTNNSVSVSNSIISGGEVNIGMCVTGSNCDDNHLRCDLDFLKIIKTTLKAGTTASFDFTLKDTKNCTILIEDSNFSNQLGVSFGFTYDSNKNNSDATINVIVRNTIFVNSNMWLFQIFMRDQVITALNAVILFANCTFENNTGGSLFGGVGSKVIFQGNNVFRNNSALIGAGVSLTQLSYIYFQPHTNVLFEGNHAEYVGGAIYIDSKPGDKCFYHAIGSSRSNRTVQVDFVGNTAQFAGSSIYGDIFTCCEDGSSCNNFYNIFNTSNTATDPSAIASDPQKVCFCDDNKLQPNCSDLNQAHSTNVFPGQVFQIRLAVVGGGFDGVVTGAVRAYFKHPNNATVAPSSQNSNIPLCTNFNYAINSTANSKTVTFELIPEQYFFEQVTTDTSALIYVTVTLLDCPLGFSFSPVTGSCVCDPRLDYSNIECNINNQSFLRG